MFAYFFVLIVSNFTTMSLFVQVQYSIVHDDVYAEQETLWRHSFMLVENNPCPP